MKRIFILLPVFVLALSLALTLNSQKAKAAFSPNLVMDDGVFDDTSSMSAAQIDSWLNTYFPSSCISTNHGFATPDPIGYNPSQGYLYGGAVSAGKAVYDAATAYDLNPQVLLATLQKEETLVSGDAGCSTWRYASAVGYGCPDSGGSFNYSNLNPPLYYMNGTPVDSINGTCVNGANKAGFSQQIIHAAWLLKFAEQRSEGNVNWAIVRGGWDNSDDLSTCYGGPMTEGFRKRCPSDNSAVFYDGYITIDGQATHMDTGATAGFYWYTPHFGGNSNFVSLFESWFGGTISASYYSCHNATNINGAVTGETVIANKLGRATDTMTVAIPNNTGSACIEAHTWANNAFQQWALHAATNFPAVNPANHKILTLDGNGDGVDESYKIDYTGTASGMIEVHGWDAKYQHWNLHIATNRPGINPADAEVIAANVNGNGKDSLFLVQYRHTGSGRIEIHQWSPDLQQWVAHVATNYGEVDPTSSQVITLDGNGDGRDEFYLVNYSGNSGRIEVHGWTPNFQGWSLHIASNSNVVTHIDTSGNHIVDVIAADTNGDGRDELYKIDYAGTSSGRVEIHGWTPNLQQWSSHVATSQSAF